MKKDIHIPKVKELYLALVHEFNSDFRCYDWNAYLVNRKLESLEMLLVVSNGAKGGDKTATMRHKIEKMPPNSVARIEYIPNDLLALDNTFNVSFFLDNQIFEKNFIVKKNSITESGAKELTLFNGSKGFILE